MIKDVKVTKVFYSKFLGKPVHEDQHSVAYQLGDTKLFLGLPYHDVRNNRFNKDRIGLNHLAFRVKNFKELKHFEKLLTEKGIKHSGILKDKYSGNPFIWFDDPDGIRLEFYVRTSKISSRFLRAVRIQRILKLKTTPQISILISASILPEWKFSHFSVW